MANGNEITTVAVHLSIRRVPIPAPQRMYSIQFISNDEIHGLCRVDDQGNAVLLTGIEEITSIDESINISNPEGPIANVEIAE